MQLPKRVLILCEGESEEHYFKSYKFHQTNRERLRGLEIDCPIDNSPLGLVKEAKKRGREANVDELPYHSIWVVFDKDQHKKIPNAFEEARTSNLPIKIAFSAICFEYWVLLHFEKKKIFFKNCDTLIRYLRQNFIEGYSKAKLGFANIEERYSTAVANAIWLRKQNHVDLENGKKEYELDSYTGMDILMEELGNF